MTITVEDVYKSIIKREKVILLDVRTAGEFARGKIEGSLNLPVDEIATKVETIIPDKSAVIYVYCLSGSRSEPVVAIMSKLGYQKVYEMTNGLLAWRAKGYPTI